MASAHTSQERVRTPVTAKTPLSEAIFAIDEKRRIVLWNNSAEAILGFSSREVLDRHCWEVFKGCDSFGRPLPCHLCQSFLHGDILNLAPRHLIIKRKDSQPVKLSRELVLLPEGPGARALVLMKHAGGITRQDTVLPEEAGMLSILCSPGWDIIKGLATMGIISHDAACDDLSQVLDSSLERVLSMTGAEAAELFLYHSPSKEMFLTAHSGLFRSAFYQIRRFKIGEGFPGLIAACGEPILTSELIRDPRYLRTQVKEKGIQSYLCVPLKTKQGVIGSLNIASRRQDLDTQQMLQFLTWTAKPLSSAVQLAWLRGKETVDAHEFDIRSVATGNIAAELEQSLKHILSNMLVVSRAQGGRVVLRDAGNGAIYHEVQEPTRIVGHCALTRPKARSGNESPFGECPALVNSSPVELFRNHHLPEVTCRGILKDIPGAVCFPLKVGDTCFGAVSLAYPDKGGLLTRHVSVIGNMADRAARVLWPPYQQLKAAGASVSAMSGKSPAPIPVPVSEAQGLLPQKQSPFLDIQCLGSFRVYVGGILLTSAHFRRRHALTIFKILVARRGHRVTSEFLSECLWPDSDPDSVKKRLWVAVHDLRQTLKPETGKHPEIIMTDGDSYFFNTQIPYRLDVDEFAQGMKKGKELESSGEQEKALDMYRKTAQLYRGAFLEEERYSDWCSTEREYLSEVYLSLLKRIAHLYEVNKDYEQAVNYYRLALTRDNLREELHRNLMACLWHAGRRDEALLQYQKCRRILSKELGVEPLEETQALYQKILSRQ